MRMNWVGSLGISMRLEREGRRDDCLLVCLGVLGQSLRVQQRGA